MKTFEQGLKTENRIDELCDRIEQGLDTGSPRRIRALLCEHDDLPPARLLKVLLEAEMLRRQKRGLTINVDDYFAEFADHRSVVAEVFNRAAENESDVRPVNSTDLAAVTVKRSQDPTPPTPESVRRPPKPNGLPASIGRYRVERLLGKGGNGTVYLAFDPRLKIDVAVKVPRSGVSATTAPLREAATLAQLNHPNIVRIYDVVPDDEGRQCIVQEYVDGQDLNACLVDLRNKGESLPLEQAVTLIATVADALAYLHRKQVIHRDIKPHNILLDKEGQPHLVDFGLALLWSDVGSSKPGGGTLLYIAPEQLRNPNWVHGSCDIFSLGAVLYELLVGEPPFGRKGRPLDEIIATIDCAEARPPRQVRPEIPAEIERICLKALAKDPAQRYTSAADMARELRQALRPPASRWPFVVAAAAVVVSTALWFPRSDDQEPRVVKDRPTSSGVNAATEVEPVPPDIVANAIYKHQDQGKHARGLPLEKGMQLKAGDSICLEVDTKTPAYCYVYWFDHTGKAHRKWPPVEGEVVKATHVKLPDSGSGWWDVPSGEGFNTLLLGVTSTPLTSQQLNTLDQLKVPTTFPGLDDRVLVFGYPRFEQRVRKADDPDQEVREPRGVFGDSDQVMESMFQAYQGWVFYHQ